MIKKRKHILSLAALVTVITVCLSMVFFPYIKAEYLTIQYGNEFESQYKQVSWIKSIEYFKVISYSEKNATVIYIEEDHYACFKVEFVLEDGSWLLSNFDCIWSATGSADGFSWPYYR